MATNNFITQKDFPLFATTVFDGYASDNDINDYYIYYKQAESRINHFNDTLKHYYIELQDGYYIGTQIILSEKLDNYGESYLTKDYTPAEWKQARKESKKVYGCYYGQELPYSMQAKEEKRELKKIIAFCREELKRDYDFTEYSCIGRFSNGEAVYQVV